MKNFILLILLCSVGIPAFASKIYAPNASSTMTGGGSFCLNATTVTAVSFKFTVCSAGAGTKVATPITVYWYKNSVNSTTGGTLVATVATTSGISTTKTVTYTPSTAVAGV